MRAVFLGKPLHWLIWIVIIGVLIYMGRGVLHVRAFNAYLAVVLLLGFGAVSAVLLSTRKDERVTREPFGDMEPPRGASDD